MAAFESAFPLTMNEEGGYVLTDRVNDAGGMTYAGISRKHHPSWVGWLIIDSAVRRPNGFSASDESRLKTLVRDFYKSVFWDEMMLDHVGDQDVANLLFSGAVNFGIGTAVEVLQESLNLMNWDDNTNRLRREELDIDGDFGPVTRKVLATASMVNGTGWLCKFMRLGYHCRHRKLALRRRSDRSNIRGWTNRFIGEEWSA